MMVGRQKGKRKSKKYPGQEKGGDHPMWPL